MIGTKLNMNIDEILIGEGQDPCPNRDIFFGLDLLKMHWTRNTYSLKWKFDDDGDLPYQVLKKTHLEQSLYFCKSPYSRVCCRPESLFFCKLANLSEASKTNCFPGGVFDSTSPTMVAFPPASASSRPELQIQRRKCPNHQDPKDPDMSYDMGMGLRHWDQSYSIGRGLDSHIIWIYLPPWMHPLNFQECETSLGLGICHWNRGWGMDRSKEYPKQKKTTLLDTYKWVTGVISPGAHLLG